MNRTRRRQRREAAGFTLIEILLVVVIIGILVGVALPRLGGRKRQAEISATRAAIENVSTAISLYELDVGEFPRALQELIASPGRDAWKGPYLQKGMPKDPWNQEFRYQAPGQRNPHTFDLWSLGPDGVESSDDITNWQTDAIE